jgi:hypothetical protein
LAKSALTEEESRTGSGLGVWGYLEFLCKGGLGVAHPDSDFAADLIQVAKMQGRRKPAIRHSRARLKGLPQ